MSQPSIPLLNGVAAILMWATLASLTTLAGAIPPFQMAAMTFAVGTLAQGFAARMAGHSLAAVLRVPLPALGLGVAGLLGYHVLYFYALQNAPAIEANIINYLWPLLIVVFSGLLPTELGGLRLRWWHIAGAVLGFAGAALALGSPVAAPGSPGFSVGHVAALGAAVSWAAYSVGSRLFRAVPSTSVIASSAVTALAALMIHIAVETTQWPQTALEWGIVGLMGLGPVGLAFTLWDNAVKQGDLRLLGVVSYATPLLSTGLLAWLGLGTAGPWLWMAVVLVTSGALLAARDSIGLSKPGEPR